jgi:hypothetical protein
LWLFVLIPSLFLAQICVLFCHFVRFFLTHKNTLGEICIVKWILLVDFKSRFVALGDGS